MPVPRGPTTITFRGRPIHRQHGFIDIHALTCPDGHRIKRGGFIIGEHGGLTCTHKASQGHQECGAMMWLLNVPGNRHQQRFYAADVTHDELATWERLRYSAEDVLRYLGSWFSRAGDPPNTRALERKVG